MREGTTPEHQRSWCPAVVVILVSAGVAVSFAAVALAVRSGLDPPFGKNGKVTTGMGRNGCGTARASIAEVFPLADGTVLAAGNSRSSIALALYDREGELVRSFGSGDGRVRTKLSHFGEEGPFYETSAAALQKDGRVVVVGLKGNGVAIARYRRDGSLDRSFARDGVIEGGHAGAVDVAVQQDGKIMVAVYGSYGGTIEAYLYRLHPNGRFDQGFGKEGVKALPRVGDRGRQIDSVVIRPDRKIVLAGSLGSNTLLMRLRPNGQLDRSFGKQRNGAVISRQTVYAYALELQRDGRPLVLAEGANASSHLMRYLPSGRLDPSFGGGDGRTKLRFFGFDLETGGGKIFAVGRFEGRRGGWRNSRFGVARYHPDGRLDRSFGRRGVALTRIGNNAGAGAAAYTDGELLVGGSACQKTGSRFALARYLAR